MSPGCSPGTADTGGRFVLWPAGRGSRLNARGRPFRNSRYKQYAVGNSCGTTPSAGTQQPRSLPVACTAETPSTVRVHVRVLLIVGVALRAMRLVGVPCGEPFASHHVLGDSNGFEVPRVDASAVAAEVVDGQPIRDGPDVDLVAPAMSENGRLPKCPIPGVVLRSSPDPTAVLGQFPSCVELANLSYEQIYCGRLRPIFGLLTRSTARSADPASARSQRVRLIVRVALWAMGSFRLCCRHIEDFSTLQVRCRPCGSHASAGPARTPTPADGPHPT
jgi:hypothetical protein